MPYIPLEHIGLELGHMSKDDLELLVVSTLEDLDLRAYMAKQLSDTAKVLKKCVDYPSCVVHTGHFWPAHRLVWSLGPGCGYIDSTHFFMERPGFVGRFLPPRKLAPRNMNRDELLAVFRLTVGARHVAAL